MLLTLFGVSDLFAQVKIDTNPTQIESTSNLEVEASSTGREWKLDKITGKMTYADGTQGAGKVLTSDANGTATWAGTFIQDTPVLSQANRKNGGNQVLAAKYDSTPCVY